MDNQHGTYQIPRISSLNEQTRLLSDASRNKYLKSEVQRAADWRMLYMLYSRFGNCVSTLAAKIRADGIPVPPKVVLFQKMMEQNWNTGNAQEAAFFMHRSDFDKVDYSPDIDKKKLGDALQEFIKEFVIDSGSDSADDILDSRAAVNELPLTPIGTMVCSSYESVSPRLSDGIVE